MARQHKRCNVLQCNALNHNGNAGQQHKAGALQCMAATRWQIQHGRDTAGQIGPESEAFWASPAGRWPLFIHPSARNVTRCLIQSSTCPPPGMHFSKSTTYSCATFYVDNENIFMPLPHIYHKLMC
eukprot:scaffold82562_cov17-Tisochrysis_lutea.AAC.1